MFAFFWAPGEWLEVRNNQIELTTKQFSGKDI